MGKQIQAPAWVDLNTAATIQKNILSFTLRIFWCIFLLKSSHWAVRSVQNLLRVKKEQEKRTWLTSCKRKKKWQKKTQTNQKALLHRKADCSKILVPDPRTVLITSCKICAHIPGNQSRKPSSPAYRMTVRLACFKNSAFLLGKHISECLTVSRKGKFFTKEM